MDRRVAASLDRWLTTQPDPPGIPLPGDPCYPTCGECGAFLVRDPDPRRMRTLLRSMWRTWEEHWDRCLGYGPDADPQAREMGWEPECDRGLVPHAPHPYLAHVSGLVHRICRKCGHENTEVIW
jgi:hypothetical protein